MVREAFKREETNSRCEDESLKQYVRDLRGQHDLDRGIVNNTGKKWQEQVHLGFDIMQFFYICLIQEIHKSAKKYLY